MACFLVIQIDIQAVWHICLGKMFSLIVGHNLPVSKPPIELVEELENAEPFMKSVLKGIPIQKAANWHSVTDQQLDSVDDILNMVQENDLIDDVILDVLPESFDLPEQDDYQG